MFLDTLNKTILNIWPQLTIFIVVLVAVRIFALRNSSKKISFHEEFLNLLFIVYILLLFELLTGTENNSGTGINLVPFSEIFRYPVGSKMFIYNTLGNILLFVPYGYFVTRYINGKSLYQIFIISFITSLTVEILQVKLGRSFDVDDIILNVVGGMIGYFIYVALNAIRTHLPKFLQKDFIYNIICFIILIVIVLYLYNLGGGIKL
ncbi:MAG: VanZ family protein [Firmicutes bacterium]|nr:VanZ family protein [Bacillota bacterium]